MKKLTPFLLLLSVSACKKKDSLPPADVYYSGAITFSEDEVFGQGQVYSSFDTSFHGPRYYQELTPAQLRNVDIIYFFDRDFCETYCFVTSWVVSTPLSEYQIFYNPSLDSSVQTIYYNTLYTADDFKAARTVPGKIAEMFADTVKVAIYPGYWGPGTSYGTHWPYIQSSFVVGFQDGPGGKRGFMLISPDQESGWPVAFNDTNTSVEIVREK